MRHSHTEPIFENRYDAGKKLAEKLAEYKGKPVVVMAIPNGGAPVALGIALALEADFDLSQEGVPDMLLALGFIPHGQGNYRFRLL